MAVQSTPHIDIGVMGGNAGLDYRPTLETGVLSALGKGSFEKTP